MPVRRTAVLAVLLAVSAVTACAGTGAPTQPPVQPPTFTGISATATDHSVAVRDLFIPDPGPGGYPAGALVPVVVQVWNNTNAPVSLTGATVSGGSPAVLIDGRSAANAPAETFDLPIGAGASINLNQQTGQFLQVRCAGRTAGAGTDIPMMFAFSNGASITADVPIGRFPDPGASSAATPAC